MRRVTFNLLAAGLLGVSAGAGGQSVPQIKLKPANAKLDAEFSMIGTTRELADGRLLVADTKDNKLVAADFKTGALKAVGRVGSGPSEFRRVFPLFAIAGDSTLMQDGGNRRWLMLHRDSIVQTIPATTPVVAAVSLIASAEQGDRLHMAGYVRPAPNQPATPGESAYVLLVRRSTGAVDTVTRIARAWSEMSVESRNPDGSVRMGTFRQRSLDGEENAHLMSDGWLAVVRLNPYRVDWRSPAGVVTKGTTLPVPPQPVDLEVKQRYATRFPKDDQGRSVGYERVRDWAAYVAPIATFCGCLSEAPDGRLLIRRQVVAPADSTRYDVVDRKGKLSGFVMLSSRERIIGSGNKAVYVAWKDEDDIERIRRHPWP